MAGSCDWLGRLGTNVDTTLANAFSIEGNGVFADGKGDNGSAALAGRQSCSHGYWYVWPPTVPQLI